MIFADRYSFGVRKTYFLTQINIGYVNLSKVKTIAGITAGSASAIDKSKQLSLVKSYSEHMERFSLGIPLTRKNLIGSVNIIQKKTLKTKFSEFSYGNHKVGYNDTTGTASGRHADDIIQKAVLELIEKNELFCFWYGDKGKRVYCDDELENQIKQYNFISTSIKIFLMNELSNYPTIIVLGFLDDELKTTGVACSPDISTSIRNALNEAKSIEWQTFNNPLAEANQYSKEMLQLFYKKVNYKEHLCEMVLISSLEHNESLKISDWIVHIEIAVIGEDINRGIKTIKCISNQLLNSIPIKKNILLQKEKEIVRKYLNDFSIDCPVQ